MSIGLPQRWQGHPLSLVALRSSAARLRYVRSLYLVTVAPASDDGAKALFADGEGEVGFGVEDCLSPADVDVPFCGESFAECFEDLLGFFVGEASTAHGSLLRW